MLTAALAAFGPAHGAEGVPRTLTFGVHPYLEASVLIERFHPVVAAVDEACSTQTHIVVSRSYDDHIDRAAAGEYSYFYIGSYAYILLRERAPTPLLARIVNHDGSGLKGALAGPPGSPFRTAADLKGKRVALADPYSTTGYVLPLYTLLRGGVTPGNLGSLSSLSTHDDVALGVLMDRYDAGGVKWEVYERYKDRGLVLIAETDEVGEYCFAASPALDPALAACVRKTLLDLGQSPRGAAVIRSIKPLASGLTEAADGDYDGLRAIVRELRAAGVMR